MKEVYVVGFVHTEYEEQFGGKETFKRRENRAAFKDFDTAIDYAADQATTLAVAYEDLGVEILDDITGDDNTRFAYRLNNIVGSWRFYVDCLSIY